METQQTQTPPPGAASHQDLLKDIENFFDTYLHKKVPFQLPPSVKEFIVQYGPWITLVLMVIALPMIFALIGLQALFTPVAMMYGGYHFGFMALLSELITVVVFVMEAIALPSLFKRSIKGWQIIYYAALVSAVGQLISFNLVGLVVGLALSMYFLFQIKEYYK
jgi:hypothetical protein